MDGEWVKQLEDVSGYRKAPSSGGIMGGVEEFEKNGLDEVERITPMFQFYLEQVFDRETEIIQQPESQNKEGWDDAPDFAFHSYGPSKMHYDRAIRTVDNVVDIELYRDEEGLAGHLHFNPQADPDRSIEQFEEEYNVMGQLVQNLDRDFVPVDLVLGNGREFIEGGEVKDFRIDEISETEFEGMDATELYDHFKGEGRTDDSIIDRYEIDGQAVYDFEMDVFYPKAQSISKTYGIEVGFPDNFQSEHSFDSHHYGT